MASPWTKENIFLSQVECCIEEPRHYNTSLNEKFHHFLFRICSIYLFVFTDLEIVCSTSDKKIVPWVFLSMNWRFWSFLANEFELIWKGFTYFQPENLTDGSGNRTWVYLVHTIFVHTNTCELILFVRVKAIAAFTIRNGFLVVGTRISFVFYSIQIIFNRTNINKIRIINLSFV